MAWGRKKREEQEAAAIIEANRAADGSVALLLPGGDAIDVVGESHYQEALETICGGKTEEAVDKACWAFLQPEPDNPFDRNAVAVYINGLKVGYLSRDLAENMSVATTHLWNTMQARCVCRAQIRGGWRREFPRKDGTVHVDEGHYGVVLGLADWEHLAGEQTVTALTTEQLANGPED